ncbi:hypothetical protein DL93DRAFT_2163058 [Clavulina sp. PMI_390]|nr:hypothetical protein DL93DRAFT_2163058 [Clavulina sp. PMI_390]
MAELLDRRDHATESIPFYRKGVPLTRDDCNTHAPILTPGGKARELALRLANLGFVLQRTSSSYHRALPTFQEAAMCLRNIVVDPKSGEDGELQETLGWVLLQIGVILILTKPSTPRQALVPLEESLDVFSALVASNLVKTDSTRLQTVADCLQKGVNLLRRGRDEEPHKVYEILRRARLFRNR